MLKTLEHTLIPGKSPENPGEPSDADRELWRRRYQKAITMFRDAGIETVSAEEQGANAYIAMRTCWNRYVVDLASYMRWPMDEIDIAMAADIDPGTRFPEASPGDNCISHPACTAVLPKMEVCRRRPVYMAKVPMPLMRSLSTSKGGMSHARG